MNDYESSRPTCMLPPPGIPPPQERRDGPIKIAKNMWLSHDIQAEVAGIILRDFMGFEVEFVAIPSSSASLGICANVSHPDHFDFNFELWVIGKEARVWTVYTCRIVQCTHVCRYLHSLASGIPIPVPRCRYVETEVHIRVYTGTHSEIRR